jgi:DNA-binding MarR family transcriptional regulator
MSTNAPVPSARRIGYVLKQVQHGLRQKMDETLREVNLTTPQYAILCSIELEPKISNAGLARAAFNTPQTTQEIVANLERAKLVERTPSIMHARILQATLTKKGSVVLHEAHKLVHEIEHQLVKDLTEDQQESLLSVLTQCAHNIAP